jgi:hypothetical protein
MKLLVKNLLPFLILLFAVLGCTEAARQDHAKFKERERVIEMLNEQFNLRKADRTVYQAVKGIEFDCRFKFYMEKWANDKLLFAEFCESTSEHTRKEEKLAAVLTPENLTLLKNAGFEKIELYEKGRIVDMATIR